MNHQSAFTVVEEMKNAAFFSERSRAQTVFCPKPRRIGLLDDHHLTPHNSFRWHLSHEVELSESKAGMDILDIILTKDGCTEQVRTPLASPSPFFCGSPPSRVSNPLTQDARFGDELNITPLSPHLPRSGLPSSPSSARKTGCIVRSGFGGSPAVRIEGSIASTGTVETAASLHWPRTPCLFVSSSFLSSINQRKLAFE